MVLPNSGVSDVQWTGTSLVMFRWHGSQYRYWLGSNILMSLNTRMQAWENVTIRTTEMNNVLELLEPDTEREARLDDRVYKRIGRLSSNLSGSHIAGVPRLHKPTFGNAGSIRPLKDLFEREIVFEDDEEEGEVMA